MGAPPGGQPGMPGGPPGGGMAAAAGGAMGAAMGGPAGPTGISVRNPLMVFGLSYGLIILANILTPILASISMVLTLVGSLLSLAGVVMMFVFLWKMAGELEAFVQSPDFAKWNIIVPIWGALQLHKVVGMGYQKAGVREGQSHVALYVFFPTYFVPKDMNNIAQSGGGGAPQMGGPGGPPQMGGPGGPPQMGGPGGPPPGGAPGGFGGPPGQPGGY